MDAVRIFRSNGVMYHEIRHEIDVTFHWIDIIHHHRIVAVCLQWGQCRVNDYSLSPEDWIYYCNSSDGGKLYRMSTSGKNRTKLNDDDSSYFNIVGEWIHYLFGNMEEKQFKMKTDGSGRMEVK